MKYLVLILLMSCGTQQVCDQSIHVTRFAEGCLAFLEAYDTITTQELRSIVLAYYMSSFTPEEKAVLQPLINAMQDMILDDDMTYTYDVHGLMHKLHRIKTCTGDHS